MRRQATTVGLAARGLLLLLTAFGLAMMHTLGHAGMQMDEPAATAAGMPAAVTLTAYAAGPPAVVAAPLPCADDHCPHHRGMDGWSICLAVLGGLAVIVLLAARLAARRHATPPPTGANTTGKGSRSPPHSPTGLLIASTAALRI